MWSASPLAAIFRKWIARRAARSLESVAERTWEIAPAEAEVSRRAVFLPGQLERVTGWTFASEHPWRDMLGGFEKVHAATRAFLLRDAWLIDGVLYKADACSHLHPRRSRIPRLRVEREIPRAAVFCTPGGNRYFGQWLMDDCVTYPLAAQEGTPVTTDHPLWSHTRPYEEWFGMTPARVGAALLREAVVFDDVGQNRYKHARFRALGAKLLSRVAPRPCPGVFIVRGNTGQRRVLRNELELAEHLRRTRGFRILDPSQSDVATIVQACAGARTVMGVEGSGLMHGIILLLPGGVVFTLQPPDRFVRLYKDLADRDGVHFAFVVGKGPGGDFEIDVDEVERTLDLIPDERTLELVSG